MNDARAVSAKLRKLGFQVIERQNLTQKQVGAVLREFRSRLKPGGVALFFYAGHGLQVKGTNYLPVVDADIASEEDVPTQALDVNKVLELMDEAKTRMNLVFLDACRNNPYARSFRSAADGLAKVNAPSGTILSFATRPGSVAADAGSGRNGLYTEHLLAAMELPDTAIEQALKRVVSGVKKASKGRQEPWMEGSIEGDFYFRYTGQGSPAAKPTASTDPLTIELAFWESIKDSKSTDDYRAYLGEYPKGKFAALAQNRVKSLGTAQKPASVPAPAGVVASLAPSAAGSARPALSAGLPKVGDTWTYRYLDGWKALPESKLTFRVLSVSEKEIQQAFLLDGRYVDELVFTGEPKVVERDLFKDHPMTEFSPYLSGLEVKEESKTMEKIAFTTIAVSSASYNPWNLKGRMLGREQVTVPAGTFDAVKILVIGQRTGTTSGWTQGREPVQILHTVWYAPEVKRIVKQTTISQNHKQVVLDKDTFELVSYRLN